MGNIFAKKNNDYRDLEIERLKNRMFDLEKADKNNDGIISKDEMMEWMEEQKKDFEEYKNTVEKIADEKYRKILSDTDKDLIESKQEIKELKKQIKSLRRINNNLQAEINNKPLVLSGNSEDNRNTLITSPDLRELSITKINQLVDEILNDDNLNIKYLPDWVEKRLYRNVLRMVLGLADHLMDTTSIHFFGHKIIFDLVPEDDNDN